MNTVSYEWDVESVAAVETEDFAEGDVIDHNHFASFAEAFAFYASSRFDPAPEIEFRVVLVRDDCDRRAWAYLEDDRTMPAHFEDADGARYAAVPKRFHLEVSRHLKSIRALARYSDNIDSAPKTLRRLIESDERIVAFTREQDGCFIYTDSAKWDDGNGSGTFRGDTVTEAIRHYKENVTRNEGGRK